MKSEHIVFIVVDCKSRAVLSVLSSARRALDMLEKGKRIDVWIENACVEKIYDRERKPFKKYIERERAYIAQKQADAERRNDRRRKRTA